MFRSLTAALLAACLALPAAAQTRWVMGSPSAEANFYTGNLRAFLADIEQATGGKLTVQAHTNGALLPVPQIKRGVQTGQVQLGEILLSAHGNEDRYDIFPGSRLPPYCAAASGAGGEDGGIGDGRAAGNRPGLRPGPGRGWA